MSKVPVITFNNGNTFPMLGLGTWKASPGEVTQVIMDAIDAGYRHLDCAHVYENEKEVGKGIAAKIGEGVVKREDLFVTSKLWNTYHRPEAVEPALRATLRNLGLEYVDLYLLHWPFAFKDGDVLFPLDEDNKMAFADHDFVPTWKAIEAIHAKGLAKNIGISNFNKEQVERLLKFAKIIPVTNQVECSPFLNQFPLSNFCKAKNITITAYSPLGSGDKKILEDAGIKNIAEKYGKTTAQILIKYQIQRGHAVVPKSADKRRIGENIDIFDFDIDDEDMGKLNSMDINLRTCPFLEAKEHKLYPFHAKY